MREKSIKTRQDCLTLLKELVIVLPGALTNHIPSLIAGIQYSLGWVYCWGSLVNNSKRYRPFLIVLQGGAQRISSFALQLSLAPPSERTRVYLVPPLAVAALRWPIRGSDLVSCELSFSTARWCCAPWLGGAFPRNQNRTIERGTFVRRIEKKDRSCGGDKPCRCEQQNITNSGCVCS